MKLSSWLFDLVSSVFIKGEENENDASSNEKIIINNFFFFRTKSKVKEYEIES